MKIVVIGRHKSYVKTVYNDLQATYGMEVERAQYFTFDAIAKGTKDYQKRLQNDAVYALIISHADLQALLDQYKDRLIQFLEHLAKITNGRDIPCYLVGSNRVHLKVIELSTLQAKASLVNP